MTTGAPGREFFLRDDVVSVARDLLGMELITCIGGVRTSGIITETEAYAGVHDRASHAWGGRRTARNEAMYAQGGTAYIYLCYGIHHLFNVVTNVAGTPHAVLVRSIRPVQGIEAMRTRRRQLTTPLRTDGPGRTAEALGLRTTLNGTDLFGGPITIGPRLILLKPVDIIAGPRIGVHYAGEDALLPYRFRIEPDL